MRQWGGGTQCFRLWEQHELLRKLYNPSPGGGWGQWDWADLRRGISMVWHRSRGNRYFRSLSSGYVTLGRSDNTFVPQLWHLWIVRRGKGITSRLSMWAETGLECPPDLERDKLISCSAGRSMMLWSNILIFHSRNSYRERPRSFSYSL